MLVWTTGKEGKLEDRDRRRGPRLGHARSRRVVIKPLAQAYIEYASMTQFCIGGYSRELVLNCT